MSAAVVTQEKAGFWIRAVAIIIDGLVIALIGNIFSNTVVATGPNGSVVMQQGPSGLLSLLYYVFFWSSYGSGQTLGMRIFKLKVVKTDGTMLDLVGSFIRYVGFVVSAICLGVGLIWAAFDANKQGWHDKIAGTYVVRTG
ncbi:MAG: hypothetical protein AUH85_05495 [Chloroflexi bacterium 13_1_40CM_4_68_4]|nr:MAG: hypothetical protein AUH85_05495 [Chloroflexi bacterium 13_1_40CM_4_68_4]